MQVMIMQACGKMKPKCISQERSLGQLSGFEACQLMPHSKAKQVRIRLRTKCWEILEQREGSGRVMPYILDTLDTINTRGEAVKINVRNQFQEKDYRQSQRNQVFADLNK